MRLIILSDTHGDFKKFWDIVERHKNDAQMIIFLGDGLREYEDIQILYPSLRFICVAGNCDYGNIEKRTALFEIGGKRIFCAHGDNYGVKSSLERIKKAAGDSGADLVLFGHTHCGLSLYEDGLHILNPGSPSCPRNSKASYGIVDLVSREIFTNLVIL